MQTNVRMRCVRVVYASGARQSQQQGGQYRPGGGFVRKSVCPPERVLRYPDGKERRIRYPCLTGPMLVECPRFEEKMNKPTTADLTTQEPMPSVGSSATENQEMSGGIELDLSSPLAFLRYVTSEEYTRRLEEENKIVRGTFDVHASCPWVVSRKVWTLGVDRAHEDTDNGDAVDNPERPATATSMYFLRTRSPQARVESELNSLLFGNNEKKIRCSSLVDGIVMFAEESDAEAFAEGLPVDMDVSLVEHDSHELFRHIVECRGVAVVMRARFSDEIESEGMEMKGFPGRLKAVLLEWDSENDDGENDI